MTENTLGKIYLQLVERNRPSSPFVLIKNIKFLVKNVPFADKKSESHLNKAIEVSKKIGAKGLQSQAYLDLGILYKAKNRPEQAKAYFNRAIRLFEQSEAKVYLKQAKNTALENAVLTIDFISVRVHCKSCDRKKEVEDPVLQCPFCEKGEIELLAGREIEIISIELAY